MSTFSVCDALEPDAGAWTFGYTALWSGGGQEAIAAITAAGGRIQRTADQILSTLDRAAAAVRAGGCH